MKRDSIRKDWSKRVVPLNSGPPVGRCRRSKSVFFYREDKAGIIIFKGIQILPDDALPEHAREIYFVYGLYFCVFFFAITSVSQSLYALQTMQPLLDERKGIESEML